MRNFRNKRSVAYAGLGIVFILLLIFTARALPAALSAHGGLDGELAGLADCMKLKDFSACTQPIVAQMLASQTGAQVMDVLALHFNPLQCHYIGHIVGQQLYQKDQSVDKALATCDLSCDSACVHGVVGEAFAEALGYDSPAADSNFDLEHLTPSDIAEIGKKLCTSADACHGVGHTLFGVYQKFAPAFSECREVATGPRVSFCYNGVAMEYADDLSSRNFLPDSTVTVPDPASLASLCTLPILGEARACFRYFPRIVIDTIEPGAATTTEALTRVQDICDSYTSADYRIACYAGIGSYQSYSVLSDPSDSTLSCTRFSGLQDQAACVLGTVAVASEDRQQNLVSFCAAFSSSSLQSACYQDLLYFLGQRGDTSTQDLVALCGNNALCQQQEKNDQRSSWDLVKSISD